jgi:lambda repressor-like predicted transcriptional regulator
VQPILAKNGWSIHDWAIESEVDFHTANNYLKGKSKPYRSTRKKLADSLGISVQDLPQ